MEVSVLFSANSSFSLSGNFLGFSSNTIRFSIISTFSEKICSSDILYVKFHHENAVKAIVISATMTTIIVSALNLMYRLYCCNIIRKLSDVRTEGKILIP